MEIQPDLAPPGSTPRSSAIKAGPDGEPSKFSQMLAEVEAHRNKVRAAVGAALIARVLFEFLVVSLLQNRTSLLVLVPYMGLAMLSYLLVLLWLSARTRDRFGFGMALGIGVLEATYLLVFAVMHRPFTIGAAWPPLVVALAHIPMAVFAFRASTAYPPLDSKQPWLIGFITALVLLSIPWIAPSLIGVVQ